MTFVYETMIIKEADDRKPSIQILQTLLLHPDCTADIRKRIEQEIRNIQAGIRGEEEAAFEMKVHWGRAKNWMLLHDLRIEHDELVAQVDHLIINRCMEMWVCESKHFSEGVTINEHGEFSGFFAGKPYGVPSPIEQNRRHILILKRFFDAGIVKLPTRLGFTIKPDLKSLVLVSKRALINRPKAKIDDLDCIIKNDQMSRFIDKAMDQNNNPLLIAKLIGQDTLETLARDIANQHKPIAFDWPAKFGLSNGTAVRTSEPFNAKEKPEATQVVQNTSEKQEPKQKLVCHSCGVSISYNVAKFCWSNKAKFGGNTYCMNCQKTVAAA